jgi:hypothetical protein
MSAAAADSDIESRYTLDLSDALKSLDDLQGKLGDIENRFAQHGQIVAHHLSKIGDKTKEVAEHLHKLAVTAETEFSSFANAAARVIPGLGPLATLSASLFGFAGTLIAIGHGVKEAATVEELRRPIEGIVGSVDLAKARMAELQKFVERNPFELKDAAEASKKLLAFGDGALAAGAGLRLVAGVAAATDKPLAKVSDAVGNLYKAASDNAPLDAALAALVKLGVLSAETSQKINAAGGGSKSWEAAQSALGVYSANLESKANTWGAIMDRIKKQVAEIFAAIGAPILEQLKPLLVAFLNFIDRLRPLLIHIGQTVATVLGLINRVFGVKVVKEGPAPHDVDSDDSKDKKSGHDRQFSHLRELGGAGISGIFGSSGQDPLLVETQRQTRLLDQIHRALSKGIPLSNALSRRPSPSFPTP